jgi:hypothetical protein
VAGHDVAVVAASRALRRASSTSSGHSISASSSRGTGRSAETASRLHTVRAWREPQALDATGSPSTVTRNPPIVSIRTSRSWAARGRRVTVPATKRS